MIAVVVLLCNSVTPAQADELLVDQVEAAQVPGTALVDVWFNLETVGGEPVSITLYLSTDTGATYPYYCPSVTGDVGAGVSPGIDLHIVWDAGVDFPGFNSQTCQLRVTADDGVHSLPFPDTPNQLMQNFVTAYENMDLGPYRDEILSPNYTFVLLPETVEEFELPDNLYEHADEVAISQHMFTGQPNRNGRVLANIEIQVLQPQGTWLTVPPSDPYFGGFPGAIFRNYSLLFYFNTQGDFRYEIYGNQLFYVSVETVMHDGVMTPRYLLLGQLDLTSGYWVNKATESMTWSSVKALWE
jgi:hypothetical protein